MYRIAITLFAATVAACAHRAGPADPAAASSAIPAPTVVHASYDGADANYYVIDPNGRTCTLVRVPWKRGDTVVVPTDCATLAASHPDLAAKITWLAPTAAPAGEAADAPATP